MSLDKDEDVKKLPAFWRGSPPTHKRAEQLLEAIKLANGRFRDERCKHGIPDRQCRCRP